MGKWLTAFALSASLCCQNTAAQSWHATGDVDPRLAGFEPAVRQIMETYDIPSGQIAVTYQGRLVLAQSFTYNPSPDDIVVQPDSLFRVASLTKSMTAIGVMRLVQEGRLDLAARVTDIINMEPPFGITPDERFDDVLVSDLLQHLGGWDRKLTFDPVFVNLQVADALDVPLPVTVDNQITYVSARRLSHDPGTTYAYSNYGFMLLGRIIEEITGTEYERYMQRNIFNPLGVWDMRIAAGRLEDQYHREVSYDSGIMTTIVLDDSGETVPWEYGGANWQVLKANAGWTASAIEYVKVLAELDNPSNDTLLNAATVDAMLSLPRNVDPATYSPGGWYYANGFAVRDYGASGRNSFHSGSLPSTSTRFVRYRRGVSYAVLLNRRDETREVNYGSVIDNTMLPVINAVSSWPETDLFPKMLPVVFKSGFE